MVKFEKKAEKILLNTILIVFFSTNPLAYSKILTDDYYPSIFRRHALYHADMHYIRGPITKISQSDCSVAGPICSKYWTGHWALPNDPAERFSRSFTSSFFVKVFTPHKMLFLFSSNFVFLLFENVRRE